MVECLGKRNQNVPCSQKNDSTKGKIEEMDKYNFKHIKREKEEIKRELDKLEIRIQREDRS